jgi:DNA-binding transcriptional ArsR family regulator
VGASVDADFSFIRAELDMSASDLSKQMKVLADAGYVSVNKSGMGPVTA